MTTPGGAADDANLRTWADPAAMAALRVEGWSDPGEIPALVAFADAVRGKPVLDIGTGTGRTVPLLRLVTSRYAGVDYTDAMVAVARHRYPDEAVQHGDARELTEVADSSYAGVVFSFNGIDAVDHDSRPAVLAAVHRVLEPGGLFLYSTLHKDGPAYRQRPWRRQSLPWAVGSLASSHRPVPLRAAAALLRNVADPGRVPRQFRNWRRLRAQGHDGGDWAMAPTDAHDFGLLVHFTTIAGELHRLETGGFEVVQTYAAEDGAPVHRGTPRRDVRWFHVLARRADPAGA
jgi:SAM-dependent methyltransferase